MRHAVKVHAMSANYAAAEQRAAMGPKPEHAATICMSSTAGGHGVNADAGVGAAVHGGESRVNGPRQCIATLLAWQQAAEEARLAAQVPMHPRKPHAPPWACAPRASREWGVGGAIYYYLVVLETRKLFLAHSTAGAFWRWVS